MAVAGPDSVAAALAAAAAVASALRAGPELRLQPAIPVPGPGVASALALIVPRLGTAAGPAAAVGARALAVGGVSRGEVLRGASQVHGMSLVGAHSIKMEEST